MSSDPTQSLLDGCAWLCAVVGDPTPEPLSPAQTTAPWIAAVAGSLAALLAVITVATQQWDRRRARGIALTGWARIEDGVATAIVLNNASKEPAFDVIARLRYDGRTLAVGAPDVVPPETALDCGMAGALEPVTIWDDTASLNTTKQGPKVQLIFRDAAGRAWVRTEHGDVRRRWRAYVWATEYNSALAECPPIKTVPYG